MAKPKELPVRRVTPQKVRAMLRGKGFTSSKIVKSGRGWSEATDGYSVWDEPRARRIRVVYSGLIVEREQTITRIATALATAGIAAEVRDEAVWVPVDQGIARL
jgi:hypothetical protein